jgi:uncharacterized protein (DUF2147 family)
MATKGLMLIVLVLLTTTGYAQSGLIGNWKTIDDESGEVRSVVEIFERNGKLYGRVLKIFPKPGEEADPVCTECPQDDSRYQKKIIGMEIIKDMIKSGDAYSDGTILDPEAGKIYRCKLWLEGSDLMVRGFWGPFYRTQTWKVYH